MTSAKSSLNKNRTHPPKPINRLRVKKRGRVQSCSSYLLVTGYRRVHERIIGTLALFEWVEWIPVEISGLSEPRVSHEGSASLIELAFIFRVIYAMQIPGCNQQTIWTGPQRCEIKFRRLINMELCFIIMVMRRHLQKLYFTFKYSEIIENRGNEFI